MKLLYISTALFIISGCDDKKCYYVANDEFDSYSFSISASNKNECIIRFESDLKSKNGLILRKKNETQLFPYDCASKIKLSGAKSITCN